MQSSPEFNEVRFWSNAGAVTHSTDKCLLQTVQHRWPCRTCLTRSVGFMTSHTSPKLCSIINNILSRIWMSCSEVFKVQTFFVCHLESDHCSSVWFWVRLHLEHHKHFPWKHYWRMHRSTVPIQLGWSALVPTPPQATCACNSSWAAEIQSGLFPCPQIRVVVIGKASPAEFVPFVPFIQLTRLTRALAGSHNGGSLIFVSMSCALENVPDGLYCGSVSATCGH